MNLASDPGKVPSYPGQFLARLRTCDLQHVISAVIKRGQTTEEAGKIGISCSQRNGASAEFSILDVDAADAMSVSCELFTDLVAQGCAIPGIVVRAHEGVRSALQKTGERLRTERGFEVKLDSVDFRSRQNCSQNRNRLGFFVAIFDARVVHEWNYDPANSQKLAA